jgi:hypothetical protein
MNCRRQNTRSGHSPLPGHQSDHSSRPRLRNPSPLLRRESRAAAPAAQHPRPGGRPRLAADSSSGGPRGQRLPLALPSLSVGARLVWNGSPHFPRAGVPQDQSAGDSEGYGCGRFGVRGRLRVPEWVSALNLRSGFLGDGSAALRNPRFRLRPDVPQRFVKGRYNSTTSISRRENRIAGWESDGVKA